MAFLLNLLTTPSNGKTALSAIDTCVRDNTVPGRALGVVALLGTPARPTQHKVILDPTRHATSNAIIAHLIVTKVTKSSLIVGVKLLFAPTTLPKTTRSTQSGFSCITCETEKIVTPHTFFVARGATPLLAA